MDSFFSIPRISRGSLDEMIEIPRGVQSMANPSGNCFFGEAIQRGVSRVRPFLKEREVYDFTAANLQQDDETLRAAEESFAL